MKAYASYWTARAVRRSAILVVAVCVLAGGGGLRQCGEGGARGAAPRRAKPVRPARPR
ncbi:unnamed protein product, partial [marine sediment metagenome]